MLVSGALKQHVKKAQIHADVLGSDHCPVSITLEPVTGQHPYLLRAP